MVRVLPAHFCNVGPPRGVDLITCQDDVFHVETFGCQQLRLNLTNTTCNDWQRSKAVFERDLITPPLEIMMADVDSYILWGD
jgi:hypothetical protein